MSCEHLHTMKPAFSLLHSTYSPPLPADDLYGRCATGQSGQC